MAREVEELKAFAILQEALALGASYANRPDRGNGRTKIKRGFEAVATLKAALARRSLPSPEAGGDEFDHDTGKLRLPPHKPAGTPEEIAAAIADLKAKLDADHKSRRLAPEAGGGNPHHWTPNQSTGGNWRCTKCGLATMEIASSATPERCSVIVASPPAPEAGGVIAEAREATLETGAPRIEWVVKQMRQAIAAIQMAKREKHTKPDPILAAINALTEWCTVLDAAVFEVECDYEAYEDHQASDLSTKDAENARLRGALTWIADHDNHGLSDFSGASRACLDAIVGHARAALNPTKGAGA